MYLVITIVISSTFSISIQSTWQWLTDYMYHWVSPSERFPALVPRNLHFYTLTHSNNSDRDNHQSYQKNTPQSKEMTKGYNKFHSFWSSCNNFSFLNRSISLLSSKSCHHWFHFIWNKWWCAVFWFFIEDAVWFANTVFISRTRSTKMK